VLWMYQLCLYRLDIVHTSYYIHICYIILISDYFKHQKTETLLIYTYFFQVCFTKTISFCVFWGDEHQSLCILNKCSTTLLHPSPKMVLLTFKMCSSSTTYWRRKNRRSSASTLREIADVSRPRVARHHPSKRLPLTLDNIMTSLKRKRKKKIRGGGEWLFSSIIFGILCQPGVSQVLRQKAHIHFRH
jgi:hypothetical protein